MTSSMYCTFQLGDTMFGLDVSVVQEVILHQEMTAVPLAPSCIRGLINLRGQIVTALDLRQRLGMEESRQSEEPMNVVVRSGSESISLLVDEIGEVVEIDESKFQRAPENLSPAVRDLIHGVHKFPDSLMLVLDSEAVLELGESAALAGAMCEGK